MDEHQQALQQEWQAIQMEQHAQLLAALERIATALENHNKQIDAMTTQHSGLGRMLQVWNLK